MRVAWCLPVVLISMFLAGCGGNGSGSSTAQISVLADFQSATRSVPGYADSLRVTVTPPPGVSLPSGVTNPFTLTRTTTTKLLAGLAPSTQPYQFAMQALTAGAVVGTASRSVTISSGEIREIDVSANLNSTITGVVVEGSSAVSTGQNSQYTAHAVDSSGDTLFSGAGFSWSSSNPSVLSVDPDSGMGTANLLGTVSVIAALKGTSFENSETVTVSSSGGVSIQVSPASATLDPSGSQQFSAQVTGAGDQGVVWKVTPVAGGGTVTTQGLYTAPALEGLYYVQATSVADPSASSEAVVTVAGPYSRFRFVFGSLFDSNMNIWMCDLAGQNYQRLTDNVRGEKYPSMSHDGSRIAFSRDVVTGGPETTNLWVRDLATGVETQLTFFDSATPGTVRTSSWSSDDQVIYFDKGPTGQSRTIDKVNVDGSGESTVIASTGSNFSPNVDPSGSRLLFISDRSGSVEIYVSNLDGSGAAAIPIAPLTVNNLGGAWSPDGSQIALIGNDEVFYVLNSTTLAVANSFPDPTGAGQAVSGITFTPDGQSLVESADADGVGPQLWAFSISSPNPHRLTDRTGGFYNVLLGQLSQ